MKILFVLEHFPPYIGGAEKLFGQLTGALAAQGHVVTVITTRFRPDLPALEVLDGVTIRRLNCGNRYLFSLLAIPSVWRAAKRSDVVHTTTYNAAFPAWVGAKLAGKRTVITFHEFWGDLWLKLPFLSRWQSHTFRIFERLILHLPFDHYVAVSDFTARTLVQSGVAEEKVIRIYNGLDYNNFTSLEHRPQQGFHYTFFGRLGVSKGLNLLLPAAAELRKTLPEARLRLVIPLRPAAMFQRINELIDELEIRDITELHHELSEEDLQELLLTSSCVVIPSYSEGFCFAAAEAVGMGVPVISSGQGALVETVGGKYLEMGSMTSEALVRLLRLAADKDYESRPVIRYSLEESIQQYLKLYALQLRGVV